MNRFDSVGLERVLDRFPRIMMGHLPTPIEDMPRFGADLGIDLAVKRDDCTGIAFGGNKVRQLEFYLGAAQSRGADVILITGAVQSNFVRTAAAMAARLGMACHIQLEDRVPGTSDLHRSNGNVLLDRMLGVTLHSYPDGEDEAGADRALGVLADALKEKGHTPFIVPLGADSPPLGALGYVSAAIELVQQLLDADRQIDTIVVASGSALTHAGLLLGLRQLGSPIAVHGVCVRRAAEAQMIRVAKRVEDTAALLEVDSVVTDEDICVTDAVLAPGYGRLNDATKHAICQAAVLEGLFLDPVYTGKVMAGLVDLSNKGDLAGRKVLFWHTGGQPALFGYADQLV